MEYFRLVLKNKLSVIIASLSFSINKAPLKNSSLDARNGLNLSLVDEINDEVFFLSYTNFESYLKFLSISDAAVKFATL